jgi:hypothetical protein
VQRQKVHLRSRALPYSNACALAVALAAACIAPVRGAAQDSLSFSTLELSAGVSANLSRGVLARAWRSSPGIYFSALTPYGPGVLRLGIDVSRRRGLVPDVPDYLAIFPSLEWGLERRIAGPVHGLAAAGLGGLWMRFEDVSNASESELALSATLALRSPLGGRWTLGAGVSARRILLSQPVDQPVAFLQVGFRTGVTSALRRALSSDATRSGDGDTPRDRSSAPIADDAPATRDSGVTRAALRERGVQRLSEVFRALPAWDRTTVDHRTLWATPDGLSSPLGSEPHVLIDGIPVAMPPLGGVTMDLLPLSLENVHSVAGSEEPGLSSGRFLERGALHFRSDAGGSEGLSLFATALAENATGDPGPFLYLDSTIANVDKLGTGYALGARWRSGDFAAAAGFRYSSDLVTDRRLGGRTLSLRDPRTTYPVVRTRTPWVSARIEGARVSHLLRAGHSERSDYTFLPALGFELPTDVTFTHVGGAGRIAWSPRLIWSYDAHGSWFELAPSPNDLGLAFDLRTRVFGAQSGLELTLGRARVSAGLGLDQERYESPLMDSAAASRVERGWLSAAADVGGCELGVDAELRRTDGSWGSRWKLWGDASLGSSASLHWSAWRVHAAPTELDGFWELHGRGYGFLATADVETRVGPSRSRVESGARVALTGSISGALTLTPFLRATRLEGVTIERYTFAPGERRPTHAGVVQVSRADAGSLLASGIEARWHARENLDVDLRYRWMRTLGGDTLISQAWAAFPSHRATQTLRWSPRADLRIGASGEISSGSRWVGYERLGVDRLPGIVQVDVWAEKTFWSRRFSVQGRLLNLLNRQNALHPLGAAPGLSAALSAAMRLDE